MKVKLMSIFMYLGFVASNALAFTYPTEQVTNLSAADTLTWNLNGTSSTSTRFFPAPSDAGIAFEFLNDSTMTATDITVTVRLMDHLDNVTTEAGDLITLLNAVAWTDSTVVRWEDVGTIPRCPRLQMIITPNSGSGKMRVIMWNDHK